MNTRFVCIRSSSAKACPCLKTSKIKKISGYLRRKKWDPVRWSFTTSPKHYKRGAGKMNFATTDDQINFKQFNYKYGEYRTNKLHQSTCCHRLPCPYLRGRLGTGMDKKAKSKT